MSRTLLVALAGVAFLMVPNLTLAEDNAAKMEFVPPENPVTDLYRALTPNGATNTGVTKEGLLALAEQCNATSFAEHPMIRIAEDGIHEYHAYTLRTKSREDACTVFLQVTLVEGKVRGTMYVAEKTGQAAPLPQASDPKPTEPENPCLAMYKEVTAGMNEEEFLALAKKHGLDDAKIHKDKRGEDAWGYSWQPKTQGELNWQVILFVEFTGGKVSKATRIPLCWREEEKK